MADIAPAQTELRRSIQNVLLNLKGTPVDKQTIIDVVKRIEGADWVNNVLRDIPSDDITTQIDALAKALGDFPVIRQPISIVKPPTVAEGDWYEYEVSYRLSGEYDKGPTQVSKPIIVLEGKFKFTSQRDDLEFVPDHIMAQFDEILKREARQRWYSDHPTGLVLSGKRTNKNYSGDWMWQIDKLEGGAGQPVPTGNSYKTQRSTYMTESDFHWERKVGGVRFEPARAEHFLLKRSANRAKFNAFKSNGREIWAMPSMRPKRKVTPDSELPYFKRRYNK